MQGLWEIRFNSRWNLGDVMHHISAGNSVAKAQGDTGRDVHPCFVHVSCASVEEKSLALALRPSLALGRVPEVIE
eukprot:2822521-Rhodomonas_salina.1